MILWTAGLMDCGTASEVPELSVPEPVEGVEGPTLCPEVSKSRVKDILKKAVEINEKEKGERF
jgi:hypothetical protein